MIALVASSSRAPLRLRARESNPTRTLRCCRVDQQIRPPRICNGFVRLHRPGPACDGGGENQMITFQRSVTYDGTAANAAVKTVSVTIQVPVFQYSDPATPDGEILQQDTGSTASATFNQDISDAAYGASLDEAFLTGGDATSRALANRYFMKALAAGNVDKLTVSATVQYASSSGRRLGVDGFDAICIPKFVLPKTTAMRAMSAMSVVAAPDPVGYFALNGSKYIELRSQLAGTSVGNNDSLILGALSFLTSLDGTAPDIAASAVAGVSRWLDLQTGSN